MGNCLEPAARPEDDSQTDILPREASPALEKKEERVKVPGEQQPVVRQVVKTPSEHSTKSDVKKNDSKKQRKESKQSIKSTEEEEDSVVKKNSSRSIIQRFRNSSSRRSKVQPPVEKVEEKVPTLDDIEAWASPSNGFECLMSTPFGRRRFSEYLEREFSSENLLFWSACESLRNIKDQKLLLAKVEEIFTTYLDVASTHEVSLDFKVKEKVMKQREAPTENIFDEAQSKIYTLMHRDSFPRFLTSSFYQELLPLERRAASMRAKQEAKQEAVQAQGQGAGQRQEIVKGSSVELALEEGQKAGKEGVLVTPVSEAAPAPTITLDTEEKLLLME